MLIIIFLLMIPFSALATFSGSGSDRIPPCPSCNLVLISIDTLRADRVGAINPKSKLTPHLDVLARSSYVYKHAYAQAPWTLPSHRSVFQGIHPWKSPFNPEGSDVLQGLPNLAVSLAEAGYQTAAITTGAFINRQTGFDRGFKQFIEGESGHDAPFITRVTKRWLNEFGRSKFFLFIHTYHVHEPFSPDPAILKQIDPKYHGPLLSIDFGSLAAIANGEMHLAVPELRRIATLYDAEILEIDRALGDLFKEFKRLGLDKNTVFVIFSDHGEEFNDRGDRSYGLHGYSVYDEQVHIPLLLKQPYVLGKRNIQSPVEATDIFSTLMSIAQIPLPAKKLDSIPLPARDSPISLQRSVFAMTSATRSGLLSGAGMAPQAVQSMQKLEGDRTPQKMIISLRKKLIAIGTSNFELFDLAQDPLEKKNLLGIWPTQEAKLKAELVGEF